VTGIKSKYLNICTSFCFLTTCCGGTTMATVTFSIPVETKELMEKHPEVNWPVYLRKRLEVRVKQLKELRAKGLI